MTIRVQAFLLCDSVVIDSQTAKTVIQGVFDKIWANAFPAVHPTCTLYARLDLGEATGCEFQISVQSPSRLRETPLPAQRVMAQGGTSVAQLMLQLQSFPLPEAGTYVFGLIVDGKTLAEYPFTASLLGTSDATVGQVH